MFAGTSAFMFAYMPVGAPEHLFDGSCIAAANTRSPPIVLWMRCSLLSLGVYYCMLGYFLHCCIKSTNVSCSKPLQCSCCGSNKYTDYLVLTALISRNCHWMHYPLVCSILVCLLCYCLTTGFSSATGCPAEDGADCSWLISLHVCCSIL